MAINDEEIAFLAEAGRKLTDPSFCAHGDLHSLYRVFRERDPVHWTDVAGYKGHWLVTRYADTVAVLQDPATYSSELSTNVFPPQMDPAKIPAAGRGLVMPWTDPPRHAEIRKLLFLPWSPREVHKFLNEMREIIAQTCAAIAVQRECDMGPFVFQIPIRIVGAFLGAPREDIEKIYHMARKAIIPLDVAGSGEDIAAIQSDGFSSLLEYCRGMVTARLTSPSSDSVGVLAGGRDAEGAPLDLERMVWNVASLFLGGFETTAYVMLGSVLALLESPEQWGALRADRTLVSSAVEECLRWTTPAIQVLRTATADAELGGRHIRKGDWLNLSVASCNRDESVFVNGDRFDVTRSPNRHIAFGNGIHTCIGNHLARWETRVFLEELLDHFAAIEFAGEMRRVTSISLLGVKNLPVRVVPA